MASYEELKAITAQRAEELITIKSRIDKNISKAPDGTLHVIPHNGKYQYYHRTAGNDKSGKYISKSNMALAGKLAQKEYDIKTVESIDNELELLEKLSYLYKENPFENVPNKLKRGIASLISRHVKPDEELIGEWLAQEYVRPEYYSESMRYDNGNGINMRSKSEILISKILEELNIPYLYEKPLRLGGANMVLPDFTLYDVRTRKEVYLEHLGMMDNTEYFYKAFNKIREYENAGLYLGDRLLITYETLEKPLDTKQVRLKLKSYFNR